MKSKASQYFGLQKAGKCNMAASHLEIGKKSENLVRDYLVSKGLTLLAENYAVSGYGELDLVFQKDDWIYIVEVRSRKLYTGNLWQEDAAFDMKKMRKIKRTAAIYIKEHQLSEFNISILCALVLRDTQKKEAHLRFFEVK